MSLIRLKAASTVLVLVTICSCAKDGEGWEYALQPGRYKVSGPTCLSSGASPAYKDVARRVNLLDFDNVVSHVITVEGNNSVREIVDSDCTMRIEQPVSTNSSSSFALQLSRKISFTPEGCTFTVSAESKSYEAGSKSSEGLADRNDPAPDIHFETGNVESGVELISANNSTLNEVWADYGCSKPDRIKWLFSSDPNPMGPN